MSSSKDYNMKIVCVTGCLGFIPSYFVEKCLERGWMVYGIDKITYAANVQILEDLKKYRESRLAEVDMKGLFPLWKKNTKNLSVQFINDGFKTHICSIDASKIPNELVGIDYSIDFLNQL